jgi:hypothetical protein
MRQWYIQYVSITAGNFEKNESDLSEIREAGYFDQHLVQRGSQNIHP